MSDFAIKVHGLGKRYRIGANQQAYRTLREKLNETALAPFRALKSLAGRNGHDSQPSSNPQSAIRNSQLVSQFAIRNSKSATFWALKDVSFEVKRGEVVGIIGRNGAGKSTLLKILSRITEPTEGYADINGRIASLLEVGTGFHPELTGRENIFLNGSILGMKRVEINKKFDEIVAFAEIEKFIDTPVKHYSSGMYVRLAFAVAAHLDPEILLVDEVLAVGDAAFQKKCLGKMGDVAKEGRTVLFVSHNMGAVSNLCSEVLWIDKGNLLRRGQPSETISCYLKPDSTVDGEIDLRSFPGRRGSGRVRIQWAATKKTSGDITSRFEMGEDLVVEFDVSSNELTRQISFALALRTSTGIPVLHIVDGDSGPALGELSGNKRLRVTLPRLGLYPGSYLLSLWVGDRMGNDHDYVIDCLPLEIRSGSLVKRIGLSWNQAVFTSPSEWQYVDDQAEIGTLRTAQIESRLLHDDRG